MAKPPTFIGVLTEPWHRPGCKTNRHKVFGTGGLLIGFTCERVRIYPITRDGVTGWTGTTTWAQSFGFYLDVAVVCGASGQAADLHQLAESGRLTPETAGLTVADRDKRWR